MASFSSYLELFACPTLYSFPLSLERFFSQPGLVTVSGGRLSRIFFFFSCTARLWFRCYSIVMSGDLRPTARSMAFRVKSRR